MRWWVLILFISVGCDDSEGGAAGDATRAPGDASVADVVTSGALDGGAPAEDRGVEADAGGPDTGAEIACPSTATLGGLTVLTESGAVEGVALNGGGRAWLTIPYAAPPVGALRWEAPSPFGCWEEAARPAVERGAVCPQYDGEGAVIGDEDCLSLNIWSPPEGAEPAPVLFWIHGGAHEQGSGHLEAYDGAALSQLEGAVVVTINYRVGPFGFMAHPALSAAEAPSGNYGMLDQIAALRWARDNISAFGGDPSRVMIFGESAGSVSVCRLLVSPLAADLFHAAVMQSGACVATPLDVAEAKGAEMMRPMGCDEAEDAAACLRGKTKAEIMSTFSTSEDAVGALGRQSFDGVVDGYALPKAPMTLIAEGAVHRVPVIIGSNSEETGRTVGPMATEVAYEAAVRAYISAVAPSPQLVDRVLEAYPAADYPSPRAAFVALTTDAKFTCTARRDAHALMTQGLDVYRYRFTQVPEAAPEVQQRIGAFHGIEILYVFQNFSGFGGLQAAAEDEAVMQALGRHWASLARVGAPSREADVAWPPYDQDDQLLIFGAPISAGPDPRAAQCDFWDSLIR